jgi:hypothetical protein
MHGRDQKSIPVVCGLADLGLVILCILRRGPHHGGVVETEVFEKVRDCLIYRALYHRPENGKVPVPCARG